MNDHHRVQNNLPLYVSGDLDDTAQVTSHLAQCSECRAACQQQRALFDMLSAQPVANAERPRQTAWLRATAAAALFAAGFVTAHLSSGSNASPERTARQPSRAYDRYVASGSAGPGMFRALAAMARAEEPR